VIPSIDSFSFTPAKLNLGGMDRDQSVLGSRERVTIRFRDHLHSDAGFDKYRLERKTGDASLLGSGTAQDGATGSTIVLASDEAAAAVGVSVRLTSGPGSDD